MDGGGPLSIKVPGGGYSSDFQDAPFIDQYAVSTSVVYRRVFQAPPSSVTGSVFHLAFGSVNHGAKVFLNGTEVGSHLGPMMPFEVDVTQALGGRGSTILLTVEVFPYNTLSGVVPSGFMYVEAWKNGTDGWTSRSCAGICRYVHLIELPPVRVTRLRTQAAIGPPATLKVTAALVNDGPAVVPSGSLSLRGAFSSWNSPSAPPWVYPALPQLVFPKDLAPRGGTGEGRGRIFCGLECAGGVILVVAKQTF